MNQLVKLLISDKQGQQTLLSTNMSKDVSCENRVQIPHDLNHSRKYRLQAL